MSTPEKTVDQTACERFTKERLQADLKSLEQQLQRAQQEAVQWQNKANAYIGAISYCQELLKGYGIETEPPADTQPIEPPTRRGRKPKGLLNGKDASQPATPAVE